MGAEAGFAQLPVVSQQIQVESQAQNKRRCLGLGGVQLHGESQGALGTAWHWEQGSLG